MDISIPENRLAAFCKANGITRLALFGSVLRDDFGPDSDVDVPASCITFLSEQAFAPQNTRFWSRSRVWFQFTVGEDKPPMLSVDNRGKGVLSMDCSAKRSPL